MSVVAVFGGSYCKADQVAERVAQSLGYTLVTERELLAEAAQRYSASPEKLTSALHGSSSVFRKLTYTREPDVSYIRATLAHRLGADAIVFSGFATHLLPRDVAHVLKVGIIANYDYRVQLAMEEPAVSEKAARRRLRKDDNAQLQWVQHLWNLEPWDPSLYDLILPMHAHSVETAAETICNHAQGQAVQTTPESRKAMADFVLAAQVYVALAGKAGDVEVTCDGGRVTIGINKFVLRLEHFKREITALARSVPGVTSVETRMGPRYEAPAVFPEQDFQLPSKVLLVDDEREFVETLSERLRARDMQPAIAYDGEDALSKVAEDEPEVMVLDLRMPGIDGMEVLRRIKQERPHVEVIILTGHGTEEDEALAKELGAFAYLEKPVPIDVLSKIMQEAYRKITRGKTAGEPGKGAKD